MRVIADLSGNNPDDPDHYMRFDEMGDDSTDNILFAHWGAIKNAFYLRQYKNYKRKVSWHGGDPCCFLTGREEDFKNAVDIENYFDTSYIGCSYTAKWLNKHHGREKFELTLIPYNADDIPQKEYEKEFDAIYWGGIHNKDHMKILDIISKFNSNFYTIHPKHWNAASNGLMTQADWDRYNQQLTGILTPRKEIWETLRKTKVFVMTNILPLNPKHRENLNSIPDWESNEAFSHADDLIAPQMKTRAVEAAFNKTLSLVKRDPWNVIEDWFEPDVDFLYFDDYEDVPDMIREITKNWGDYTHIVDNAFEKAMNNYSSQKLFERMKGEGS